MSLLSERHLMTVVINMHKPYFIFKTCHGYEGVMPVLWTPLQVKCYRTFLCFLRLSLFLVPWIWLFADYAVYCFQWVLTTRLFIAVLGDFLFDCQFLTGDMSGNPAGEITVSSWILTVDLMIKDIKKSYFGSNLLKT